MKISNVKVKIFPVVLCILFFLPEAAAQDLATYCAEQFYESETCPDHVCYMECAYLNDTESECVQSCLPVRCYEIDAEHCPEAYCDILVGCNNKEVCYDKVVSFGPDCSDEGDVAQDLECCEGLIRRCGIEYFDGSCNFTPMNSMYSVPLCLPCGNGICNQFEDPCNCPEDCGEGTYQGRKLNLNEKESGEAGSSTSQGTGSEPESPEIDQQEDPQGSPKYNDVKSDAEAMAEFIEKFRQRPEDE